jgi:general secretion pathway protein G
MKPQISTWARRASGFTLIEIMVVVVIIGLLAAIVAPNVIRNLNKATVARAKQDIRTIQTAMAEFYSEHYRYPTEDEGLQILAGQSNAIGQQDLPKYIERVPRDPWQRDYLYNNPGQRGGDYDVYTLGADGEEGGEDVNADIGNWNIE